MSDDPVLYFSQPEDPNPGDLWITPVTYVQRTWDGEQWVECGECGQPEITE